LVIIRSVDSPFFSATTENANLNHRLQLAFRPFSSVASSGCLSAYTGGQAPSGTVVGKTLSRVGLSWGAKVRSFSRVRVYLRLTNPIVQDSVSVSAFEKRLVDPPLPPYNFLVGTKVHNEGQNIVEWLLYHISQGMDHFMGALKTLRFVLDWH
jgi:hypothetical protein